MGVSQSTLLGARHSQALLVAQEDVVAAQLERCAALEEAQHVDLDCHRQT